MQADPDNLPALRIKRTVHVVEYVRFSGTKGDGIVKLVRRNERRTRGIRLILLYCSTQP